MPSQLSNHRHWLGFSVIAFTLVLTYGLWIGAMWAADDWYETAWKYPAKVGSHGTLILMCWAFILATRFRPVEWLFGGLDKVYKAHRIVGETAFFLIFLHPIFLAVASTEGVGGFFRYLWFSDNWVRNSGIIALLVFILLVVLSIYVKIAYHRWKRTHDFFGVLLMIVVIHAVISGGEIMAYPVLTIWHGAWVAVGLSAYVYIRILYRFIGPQYDYETEAVREIGDAVTEVYLSPVGRPLKHAPGQVVYISFDADAVSEEPHPFSISSPPESGQMRLSIKRLGDWTQSVDQIKQGEPARIWGPYGHFGERLFNHPELPAVLIGGGIGITPFVSILESEAITARKAKLWMIYSAPKAEKLVYGDALEKAAARADCLHYRSHISDEEGFIDAEYLEKILGQPLDKFLYLVCGPGPMMTAMENLLLEAGVKPKQIVMEDFAIR